MSNVWLVRHGESVSNANLPTGNPVETAMTAQGFAQAELIANAFTAEPDLIVVSPYLRAQQTAVPTLARFPNTPHKEWPVHEFTYLAPIRYAGTTGTERRPLAIAYWERNDPYEHEGDAGESFSELLARVQETITRLRQHPAEFIVVFSHGLFLRALIWSALTRITEATPKTMKRYSHFTQSCRIPNGAIIRAKFPLKAPISISEFDTSHLE